MRGTAGRRRFAHGPGQDTSRRSRHLFPMQRNLSGYHDWLCCQQFIDGRPCVISGRRRPVAPGQLRRQTITEASPNGTAVLLAALPNKAGEPRRHVPKRNGGSMALTDKRRGLRAIGWFAAAVLAATFPVERALAWGHTGHVE